MPLTHLLHVMPWLSITSWLLLGLGLSLLVKFVTHFHHVRSDGVARAITGAASFLTGASAFVLTSPGFGSIAAALPIVAKYTSVLFTLAHFWFWLVVQPLYKKTLSVFQDAANYKELTAPQPLTPAEPAAAAAEEFPV